MALSGIKISSTFRRRTAIPLDLWYVQDSLNDRDNIPSNVRYEGMPVYVVDVQKCYKLIGGVLNINWKDCDSSLKYNLEATINPTNINNASEGYSEGSLWYNQTDDQLFILTTFAGSSAVWVPIGNLDMIWTTVNW